MPAPQTRSSASSPSFAVPILLLLLPQPRSVSSRTIPLIKSLDPPISCAAYRRPRFLAPSNGRRDQRIHTPQPASTTLVQFPASPISIGPAAPLENPILGCGRFGDSPICARFGFEVAAVIDPQSEVTCGFIPQQPRCYAISLDPPNIILYFLRLADIGCTPAMPHASSSVRITFRYFDVLDDPN
ncbi:hypothetical protein EJB05_42150, partial [Eragrostis curvula]